MNVLTIEKNKKSAIRYFSGLLEGYENRAEIPSYGTLSESEKRREPWVEKKLDAGLVTKLDKLCQNVGATLSCGMELVWGMVLRTACRLEDVVFAVAASGKDNHSAEVSDSAGHLIHVFPVRVKAGEESTAAELLKKLREQADARRAFDLCELEDIEKETGMTGGLAYSILSFENNGDEGKDLPITKAVSEVIRDEHPGCMVVSFTVLSDGNMDMILSFNPERYRKAEMERLLALMENFVACMAEKPHLPVCSFPLMDSEKEAEVIALSRGETYEYDTSRTWVDMLLKHAKEMPENVAVRDSMGEYTYGELDDMSNRIAAWLKEQGTAEGSFVAIRMGRVKEFLAAVLGVHKAGAAYVPVDSAYPEERISYMLEDSETSIILTEETVAEAIAKYPDAEAVNRAVPEGHAYMLYTSGSTGKPKGVVISQHALCAFVAWKIKESNVTKETVHAVLASLSFAASVNFFCVLAAGGTVHIISEEVRRDLVGMKDYIVEHHINWASIPMQLGMAMVNQYPDLPLKLIVMGGEKMLPCRKTDIRLLNEYGCTEYTCMAVFHYVNQEKDQEIPLGRPAWNTWAFICDEHGHLLPRGMAGEMCLAGNQIAEGYWKQPELTARSFVECPFLEGQRMYRTGDLVRYNEAGDLEHLGRINQMVKLRGFRIEMGEIEARARRYAGVEKAAAAVRKEHLVLYYTREEGMEINTEQLKSFLAKTLAEYMVPTVYMPIHVMPMTPSGKIDRKALPEPDIFGAAENISPETETEDKLLRIAARVLGRSEFGVTDDLVSLGMSSIGAARLAAEIGRVCHLRIPVAELLRTPMIRAFAALVDQGHFNPQEQLRPYLKQKRYPITENQRGIIVDWEQSRGNTQYNIPVVTVFEGVDGKALVHAVKAAIEAHAYLKTRFVYWDGDVTQERRDEEAPVVSLTPLEEAPDRAFFRNRIRPFELLSERLYRMEVYTFGSRAWLFMDIHHTVYDGLSGGVFLGAIQRALSGESLKGETLTAYDFALYEHEFRKSDAYAEGKKYFDGLMEGAATAVLPDSRRQDETLGGTFSLSIPAEKVNLFCKECGVTAGSFFQAAFGETLRRITREEKPFYVTVSNGRSASSGLMDSVGMFVKTMPVVVVQKSGDMTSMDYVRAMHQELREIYAREFYPYTELVENHGLRAEMMFVYQGGVLGREVQTLDSEVMESALNAVKLPICMELFPEDGNYILKVEYDSKRYNRSDIESFAQMVKNAALGLTKQKYVREVSLVSADEAKKLLELSSGETLEYNKAETWVDLFLKHGEETPEKTAVVDSTGEFTYKELDEASNSIAVWLIEHGVTEGSFVALRMGRVKEFLAAVIGVHKIGAAYVPIDPAYPEERIAYMLEDSEAKAVLKEETVAEAIAAYPNAAAVNRAVPEGRAYMIYTSGSTGKPKGVVQRHRSLSAFAVWRMAKFQITESSVHAVHASFSFDASLDDLICPIAAGGTIHILSEEMRRDMADIKDYLTAHRVSMATFSTQIGMALVNRYPELTMRYLIMGGEKLLPCRKTDIRLVNGYGPTEFTVCSSYHVVDQEKDTDIPIGRPVPNTYSFICDTYGHILPQGMTGELCLAGNQIAEGYWKKPELTAKSFVECSFLPGQKMYRTGDLARYNESGELEYLGRIDNQVKLRGFRIELGEIETRAGQYDGIGQVAAEVRKERLVLYYTNSEEIEIAPEKLKAFLAETLTEYMVPTAYVPLEAMPMTPNGKIDRKALPEPELSESGEILSPETETESKLFEIAAKLLGRSNFGVTNDLVGFGLSSIGAMRFAAEIDRACGMRIPVADILRTPTVRALAAWMDKGIVDTREQLTHYPKQELYPITENQRGIIIDWEQNRGTTQYNVPEVVAFDSVDGNALVEAVKAALNAHVYLKTGFVYGDGDVMQQRRDEDEPVVSLTELNEEPDRAFFQSRILPFELFTERLYRMEVYTFENRTWLFKDIHHTVYDGLSRNVFMGDVRRALSGKNLKGETLTAYDFALYEHELRESESYAEAKKYFDALMEGASTAIFPESHKPDEKPEGRFVLSIPAVEVDKFCGECGVTAGSFFQAAFGETLRRITREEKPFYVTVSNGRSVASALMDSVGMFVKTLPVVVVQKSGDMTCKDYVRAMHEELRESYAHEFYPYTELLETHGRRAEMMVVYQGGIGDSKEHTSTYMELVLNAVKLPITMEVFPKNGNYILQVEYDGMRYSRTDAEAFAEMVRNVAFGLAKQTYVKEVSPVSADEAKKLLELSSGETLEYNKAETWVDLFLKHGEETPEKTAVVDSVGEFTYKELDKVSNSIAAWLIEHGVTEGSFVAFRMGRVKEFLAAVIGVHKIGAAYVPIDPAYPEERNAYMLEDSEAKAVLTEETVAEAIAAYPNAAAVNRAVPEGRAYMIYTSGSTGKPKGVVLSHRGLRALVAWTNDKFDITEDSIHAEHPSFSFDASLMDLICPVAAGGTMHILSEEMRRDIAGMRDYFVENNVDVISLSMQIGMAMLNQYPDMPLRCLMMGGEKMLPCKKTNIRLINEYGPTEFTVCSSYHVVDQEKDTDIPIGRPVPNTWSFICDDYGHLLPKGMMGELCLAGSQIAEGYWKKPELTAKSFVECSFLTGQKMYRTGDLARYNEAGELEYLGRIDNMVKLRGFRIELGEIENRAGQYAGIEQVAAAVRRDQLVLYYTHSEGTEIDSEEFKSFLADTLTEYMVPTVYMPLDVMPMAPNDKIDRKALPEPEVSARTEYEAPEGEMERKLCETFENVLGLAAGTIGRNDDFFLLGGSSIKAMMVMSKCGIEGLGTKTIFKYKTARLIAEAMADKAAEDLESYEQVARSKSVPATFGQISMLDYQFLNPHSVMHNIPLCYCFDASFDAERLSAAVNQAIRQHPALSTIFDVDENGNIVQRIEPDILEKTVVEDVSAEEWKKLTGSLVSPFEMFRAPLFRARLFRCGEELYLFMDMHHTISDGMSLKVLLEDINKAYRHEKLERDYYYSYIRKEYENREAKEYKEAKQYFSNLLSGRNWCSIPTTDYESWGVERGEEEYPNLISVTEIKSGEERLGVSRNVIAIAAAMLAMREYCQRDEIRVDYLNNNRTDAYLQHTVGLIFKILPLAVDIGKYTSMKALLQEISRQVVDGLAHSICDYGSLDNVALDDALDINYLPDDGDDSGMSGIKPMELNEENTYNATESHVEIYLTEENGQVHLRIEYQRKAYAEGSMKRFLDMYVKQFRQLLTYIC